MSRYAEASFVGVDASGCITSSAVPRLIPTAGLVSQSDGERATFAPNTAFADLTLQVFNTCQNTLISQAYAETTVPSSAFSFNGGLMSATLNADITLCDRDIETFECLPGTTRAVLVDVTWTGFGDIGRFHQQQVSSNPPFFIDVNGASGAGRAAEAVGTILDGATDYAAGITGQGVLQRFTSHSLSIVH